MYCSNKEGLLVERVYKEMSEFENDKWVGYKNYNKQQEKM